MKNFFKSIAHFFTELKKPDEERGFTDEGILYRKGNAMIKKPTIKNRMYQVRIVNSKPGKLEPGECDLADRKSAFSAANKLDKLHPKKQ